MDKIKKMTRAIRKSFGRGASSFPIDDMSDLKDEDRCFVEGKSRNNKKFRNTLIALTNNHNTSRNLAVAIDAIDDVFKMNATTPPDILLGSYNLDDWLKTNFLRESIIRGENVITEENKWITLPTFSFVDWVHQNFTTYTFLSSRRAICVLESETRKTLVEIGVSREKLMAEITGEFEEVGKIINWLDTEFKRAENMIEWVYDERGNSVSVPLNYRQAVPEAYPWLPKPLDEYVQDYFSSSASVLILLGPPGTGKTTFIKHLIHASGADAKVTYDTGVMDSDGLFAGFIEGTEKFMIMEDSDAFLRARTDGNTMMHRFLNVSDGLISADGKKLVFSTNLPSIRDIDEALMRPGRCFDIIEFRPLTRTEALKVANKLGINLPDGTEFTLAEIFGQQVSGARSVKRHVGFIG